MRPSSIHVKRGIWLTFLLLLSPSSKVAAAVGDLVQWGPGSYYPPRVTNLVAIAAGQTIAPLGATADGIVVEWLSGIPEPVGISNVVSLACGYAHSLGLQADGRVVGFGSSWYGETSPPPALTNVLAVSAGYRCSLALRSDNTVQAWGYNFFNQTNVPSDLSNVVAISMGPYHSLALKSDGTVVAWGYSANGATSVPAGLSNVVAIAAGDDFSLALTKDGQIVPWGWTDLGRTAVPAGTSNVVAIAAGEWHGLALKSDGTVVAWGYDNAGQTDVPPGLTNVVSIAAGGYISLALTNNGAPAITWQPQSHRVYTGSTLTLRVGAVGTPPLGYQWCLNGTNLENATDMALTLTNFSPIDSGIYTVVITNSLGAATSSPATLQGVTSGPVIVRDLTNLTAVLQDTVILAPTVEGSQPLAFDWRLNGSDIPSATNAALVLTNLQAADTGAYQVLVTNPYGSVLSTTAVVSIIPFQILLPPRWTPYGLQLGVNGCPAQTWTLSLFASGNGKDWYQVGDPLDVWYPPLGATLYLYDQSATNQMLRFYRVRAQ